MTTNTSKANEGKVLANGGWHSKRDCPDAPARKSVELQNAHFWQDVSAKPGKDSGEKLVTSKCKYCGGLIVDCLTIGIM